MSKEFVITCVRTILSAPFYAIGVIGVVFSLIFDFISVVGTSFGSVVRGGKQ